MLEEGKKEKMEELEMVEEKMKEAMVQEKIMVEEEIVGLTRKTTRKTEEITPPSQAYVKL